MPIFNTYAVYPQDVFKPEDYPEITIELDALSKGIRFMPGFGKVRAIVSYLKDRGIQSELVRANPVLINLIRIGSFKVTNIESMFECCRENRAFFRDYEQYIFEGLNEVYE